MYIDYVLTCICVCAYIGSKSARQKSSKEAARLRKIQLAEESSKWFDSHLVDKCNWKNDRTGLVKLPVAWLVDPDEDLAAREVDDDTVNGIVDNILNGVGHQHGNVKIMVWNEELRDAGLDPDNLILKDGNAPAAFFAIAGGHTKDALKKCILSYPKNPSYKQHWCKLATADKTEENMEMVRLVGTIDNIVASTHKKMTTWDYCLQMRKCRVRLLKQNDTNTQAGKQKFNKAWSAARKTFEARLGISANSIGSMMVFASVSDEMWSRIYHIFTGKVQEPQTFKKPTACTYFNQMSDIPEDVLCAWLDKIITREYTPNQFMQKCKNYKIRESIENTIVNYAQCYRPRIVGKDCDYKETMRLMPYLDDKDWFDRLTLIVGQKKRDDMIKLIEMSVKEKIDAAEDKAPVKACLL